jgi:DNA-binding NtrC family response regulator
VSRWRTAGVYPRGYESYESPYLFGYPFVLRIAVLIARADPTEEGCKLQLINSQMFSRGGRVVGGVSEEAMTLLRGNEWPGNVRELRNVLERAVVLGSESVIIPEDLPERISGHAPSAAPPSQFHEAMRFAKKELLLNAGCQADGNLTKAAQILALQPTYLHRLIRTLDLREEIRNRFKK